MTWRIMSIRTISLFPDVSVMWIRQNGLPPFSKQNTGSQSQSLSIKANNKIRPLVSKGCILLKNTHRTRRESDSDFAFTSD